MNEFRNWILIALYISLGLLSLMLTYTSTQLLKSGNYTTIALYALGVLSFIAATMNFRASWKSLKTIKETQQVDLYALLVASVVLVGAARLFSS